MIFNSFYKGIAKSEEQEGLMSDCENLQVFDKLGVATCNPSLARITGANQPDEAVIGILDNAGALFLLGKTTGKIWKMATNETFTLAHTNANTAHKGGGMFNNKLWYSTATKVGSFDGSTWTDTVGTFVNGSNYKPFLRTGVNKAFAYFGDGANIASINKDNGFNGAALEIPVDERVTDIAEWGDDICFAAFVSDTKPTSKMYRWNQYGDTYYKPDIIPDSFVSCLLESTRSNILFALTPNVLMYYTGTVLEQLKELAQGALEINSYNKTTLNGRTYFAVGNIVYSLHRNDPTLPFGLIKEHILPTGHTIDSLESNGTTIFITSHTATEYFVYKVGTTKEAATITLPIIDGLPKNIYVNYRSMPTGCSISGEIKINGGDWATINMKNEPEEMRYSMYSGIPAAKCSFSQVRITLTPSGTTAPIINSIELQ